MKPTFHYYPIDYYVDRLASNEPFALVGYSDAEWFSILRHHLGHPTSLGQTLHGPTGDMLLNILKEKCRDPNFLFAVPSCMWELPDFVDSAIHTNIEGVLDSYGIDVEFYERDMILDDLAKEAGLFPLIDQLRKMPTVMIGPKELETIDFLGPDHQHIPIESPNLHLYQGLYRAFSEATNSLEVPHVYLVSAGMSAPLIINRLYDWYELSSSQPRGNFYIDCGSIWDAFVGIGGQRAWRKELYDNHENWEKWVYDNLHGKS